MFIIDMASKRSRSSNIISSFHNTESNHSNRTSPNIEDRSPSRTLKYKKIRLHDPMEFNIMKSNRIKYNHYNIYNELKNIYNNNKIKVLTEFIDNFFIDNKNNIFYKQIKYDIQKKINLLGYLKNNNVFQMHLFIILKSNEYYIKNDIIYLAILSSIMTELDENALAIMYKIDYKYIKFIQHFLKLSGLEKEFKDYLPLYMENYHMSNTYVKDIINIFINKLIIKNKRIDGKYIIFNFTNMGKKFEIKIPIGWDEKKSSSFNEAKTDKYITENVDNVNKILISYLDKENIGFDEFQKDLNKFEYERFDKFYTQIINNKNTMLPLSKQEGGKKKRIQVKNTKNSKIITGPRGGKYKILPNGKKYYMSK